MRTKHSIIIPTAGRPHSLKLAICSLLSLSRGLDEAEIIVVDNDAAADPSGDLARYCQARAPRVRYVREPSPGATAARHRGVLESRGDILVFVDDDVEVSSGWLNAIRCGFEDPEVAIIGGPSVPKFTSSVPSWFWDFMSPTPYGGWMCSWLSLLDIGQTTVRINPNYIWSLNLSVRRSVFERCGGFHPGLVPARLQRWQGDEETGFTMTANAAGIRADYLQEALLFHRCGPDRLNPQYFAKRAFYQGVCDSFARIRAGDEPDPDSTPRMAKTKFVQCRSMVGSVVRRLLGRRSIWNRAGATVRQITDKAYIAGWQFHQKEAATDPKLITWVRRPNFLDSDIRNEIA